MHMYPNEPPVRALSCKAGLAALGLWMQPLQEWYEAAHADARSSGGFRGVPRGGLYLPPWGKRVF